MNLISIVKSLTPMLTSLISNYISNNPKDYSNDIQSINKILIEEHKTLLLLSDRLERIKNDIDTIKKMVYILIFSNILFFIIIILLIIK